MRHSARFTSQPSDYVTELHHWNNELVPLSRLGSNGGNILLMSVADLVGLAEEICIDYLCGDAGYLLIGKFRVVGDTTGTANNGRSVGVLVFAV